MGTMTKKKQKAVAKRIATSVSKTTRYRRTEARLPSVKKSRAAEQLLFQRLRDVKKAVLRLQERVNGFKGRAQDERATNRALLTTLESLKTRLTALEQGHQALKGRVATFGGGSSGIG